jgi:hypothetical protein
MANLLLKSLSVTSSKILTFRLGAADRQFTYYGELLKLYFYMCHKMTILQHIISSYSKPTLITSLDQTMICTHVRKRINTFCWFLKSATFSNISPYYKPPPPKAQALVPLRTETLNFMTILNNMVQYGCHYHCKLLICYQYIETCLFYQFY